VGGRCLYGKCRKARNRDCRSVMAYEDSHCGSMIAFREVVRLVCCLDASSAGFSENEL
jgi:hypothetical protein